MTLNIAPWETPNIHINCDILPAPKPMTLEAEVHQHFRALLASHQHSHHLYTDGSKTDDCVGASIWSNKCALRYRLPNHTSVFSSELFAIEKLIDYATNSHHDSFTIFSDSMAHTYKTILGFPLKLSEVGKVPRSDLQIVPRSNLVILR